jgi:uncharacterized protein YndB with AHSA1/START domain
MVRLTPFAASLVLVLASTSSQPRLPGEAHPTPTGTVWVEMASAGADKPREGIGRGVIAAPPERVWRALTDYAHWSEFMPFLEGSDARPQPDGSVLSTHVLNFPAPIGGRRYRVRFVRSVEATPPGKVWRIRWAAVPGSGNVTDHRGSWTLTALAADRTLAVCRLYTDPGGFTPRWAMDRGTARMLPWIFDGLRQHVRRSRYDHP